MTLRTLSDEGAEKLLSAEVPDARRNARLILLSVFGLTLEQYVSEAGTDLSAFCAGNPEKAEMLTERYREKIARRAQRVPLQQITGEGPFMGFSFRVTEDTLSPRPDTETLCEEVLRDYVGKDPKLLDLCTGTGCIGISIKLLGNLSDVTLSDISDGALSVASENASRLCPGGIRVVKSDLLEAFAGKERFQVIVSNPPYIKDSVIETLEPEVRDYEPRLALSGGADGLDFYRKIIGGAKDLCEALYLEIGYDQAEAVTELMRNAGFTGISVIRDCAGNDRVVKGKTGT